MLIHGKADCLGQWPARPLCMSHVLPAVSLSSGHDLFGISQPRLAHWEPVHIGIWAENMSNGQQVSNAMLENLGVRLVRLEPQLCCLQGVLPWTSPLFLLSLSLFKCKIETIRALNSWSCSELSMRECISNA